MGTTQKTRHFTTNDYRKELAVMLDVYGMVRNKGSVPLEGLLKMGGMAPDDLKGKIYALSDRNVVELSGEGDDELSHSVSFREGEGKGFIGVSFEGHNCRLVVLDSLGNFSREEILTVETLKTLRGRVGEIKKIVKTILESTSFKGIPFRSGGVVVDGLLEGKEKKGVSIIAEGLSRAFRCDFAVARRAVACAYAEKNLNPQVRDKNILYMHTDSGEGVVVEGEQITESASPGIGKASYLRAWQQFDAVKTTKNLISKGLGSDVVQMVGGDVDMIDIPVVFAAAEKGDELALDLVKRSALALGVRTAYLNNIFDVDVTVLGGGLEKSDSEFRNYMEESYQRFLLNEKKGKTGIVNSVAGEGACSHGAALLCLRETFTEVI